MKPSILARIKALGGNIDNVKGETLEEIIPSITFDTVLYERPIDTPWAKAEEQEPIYEIGAFIEENMALFHTDKEAFYNKIFARYYCLTEEGYGQAFWRGKLFTPFREGTADFEEWNVDFTDEDTNLTEVIKVTNDPQSNFVQLFYTYSFPDNIYVSLSDPNPENPTVFGTDHERFFIEIENLGTLEDYLNNFLTKEELRAIIEKELNK